MKKIIVIALFTQLTFAESLSLEALLNNAQQPQKIKEMIEMQLQSKSSKTLADIEEAPLTFNHSLARSQSPNLSGFEHEIGFSKEFKLGNIQSLEKKASRLNAEARSIEQELFIVSIHNRMKNAYHVYCLDAHYSNSFQEKQERFSLLYRKKQKAYQEDEIAKTELLQIELENAKLESALRNFRQKVEDEKSQLLRLGGYDESDMLSCEDVYNITPTFNLEGQSFELTTRAYEKRMEGTQASLKRYGKSIESIEVSTGYLRELERDVYSVGVSIPLNFTSRKSEYERAAIMHESSAVSIQKEQQIIEKTNELEKLKLRLKRQYQSIVSEEENIESFRSKLLPLMKKSYDYGESSVVEYLLSQQQLSDKEESLLAKKKGYYETLFTLYNISEKR